MPTLLGDADAAMYRAERAGAGSSCQLTPELRTQVVNRMQLDADLRDALRQRALEVHQQPIVDLATGDVLELELEALVRWNHPERGAVSPTAFVSPSTCVAVNLPRMQDDFGTGWASLSTLRDLPADVVKIDRSFADRMTTDPQVSALVRGIVDLAHALELEVVGEGVETGEQSALLAVPPPVPATPRRSGWGASLRLA
ncbi:MAG: EAL domain-containing protein [Acidimicrobiia bacterium]